ncbi:uncharacterized protein LOC100879457 [Megachile rotundata]|uniref:uncharacterized protein LOC100879457 n=1 Tax=Megachile rotundata TaxID=143995 RepID=UPI000258E47C|nr:PREDICTED: uncharacterized protein LOC100879457 [Megachile rotundata]XP_012142897.1 PREDICTED: uncharacterized protein LOC100879457 [Megachile rotundata]
MVFDKIINNTLNNIPGVGHTKAAFHYLSGDRHAAKEAFNAANRSTVVVGAATVTGGLGAIPAAMAYDVGTSIVTGEPQGYVAATKNLVEDPSLSTVMDAGLLTVGDVVAGSAGAKGLRNALIPKPKGKSLLIDTIVITEAVCASGKNYVYTEATKTFAKTLSEEAQKSQSPRYGGDSSNDDSPRRSSGVHSHKVSEESSDEESTDEEDEFDIAFTYDDYEVDTTTPLTPEEKNEALQKKKNQTPEGNLPKNINKRDVKFSSKEELNNSKERFNRQDPSNSSNVVDENLWRQPVWLHLRMPHTFNYTGAIVTNTLRQGLLHILIRHGHQFAAYIPDFQTIFDKLPKEIRDLIRRVQKALTDTASSSAISRLERALRKLDSQTSQDVDEILFELQMKLYDYIQENILFDGDRRGYAGEGCNNHKRQTVFFKPNNDQILVIGVSDELYHNPLRFGGDRRPVRAVITSYYITGKKYEGRYVDILFDLISYLRDN